MNLNIKKIFGSNYSKIIMLIFLLLASFCALNVEDAGLCVMIYYEKGVVTYIHKIQGSQADDSIVFGVAGVLDLFFSPMYFLKLSRPWWIGLFTSLCVLQFLSLCLVTIPLNQIIHDSVKFCDNFWLLGFLIFHLVFIILNLIYINLSSDWK